MMLLTRACGMENAIHAVQEKGGRLQHVQTIQSIAQKLKERSVEIRGLLTCRLALLERGCDVATSSAPAKAAADVIRGLQNKITADALVAADPNAFAPVLTSLGRVTNDLRAAIRTSWSDYADQRIPSINNDVLAVLRRIDDFREQVARVDERLRDLRARRDAVPLRPEEISAFDVGVDEVDGLWHSLGGDSLSSELLTFLRNSGTGGASLDSLTPVVAEWLRDKRLWSSFKITIAKDQSLPTARR